MRTGYKMKVKDEMVQLAESERMASRPRLALCAAALAFFFRKQDGGAPVNKEKNLAKVTTRIPGGRRGRLPHDIDYYSFSKVDNFIYFEKSGIREDLPILKKRSYFDWSTVLTFQ